MRIFRKMSRYIMQVFPSNQILQKNVTILLNNTQTDILDLQFTVRELMLLAANLKLGNELKLAQKLEVVSGMTISQLTQLHVFHLHIDRRNLGHAPLNKCTEHKGRKDFRRRAQTAFNCAGTG